MVQKDIPLRSQGTFRVLYYQMVRQYIEFYNTERRRHTEIGKVTPDQIYNLKNIAS